MATSGRNRNLSKRKTLTRQVQQRTIGDNGNVLEQILLQIISVIGVERTNELMAEHFPAKAATSAEHENTKIKQASKSEDPVIKNIIERIEKIERWIEMQTPPAPMIDDSSNLKDFELWNQVLLKLQQTLSKPSFDTWFSGTIAKLLDEDVILVLCKNEFQSDWLSERYKEEIFFTVEEVAGRTFELEFTTMKSLEKVLS